MIFDDVIAHAHNVAMVEDSLAFQISNIWFTDVKSFMAQVRLVSKDFLASIYMHSRRMAASILRRHGLPDVQEARNPLPIDKDTAKRLAGEIDLSDVEAKVAAKVRNITAKALEAGKTPMELAIEIQQAVTAPRNWKKFARTEIQRVNNVALQDVYSANKNLLLGEQFAATLDSRTCPICQAYDGKIFYYRPAPGQVSIAKKPKVPVHPHCRCTYVPVLKSPEQLERETGIPAGFLPQNPPKQNYDQWVKSQPKDVQKRALGDRYDLFKSGATLDQFVSGGRVLDPEELDNVKPGEIADVKPVKPLKSEKRIDDLKKKSTVDGVSRPSKLFNKGGIEVRRRRQREGRNERIIFRHSKDSVASYDSTWYNSADIRGFDADPIPDVVTRGIDLNWPVRYLELLDTEDGYVEVIHTRPTKSSIPVRVHPRFANDRVDEAMKTLLADVAPKCPFHGLMEAVEKKGTEVRFRCECCSKWVFV
jgi:SPP1 gp7 family putative phage head morphogenesis protein